MAPGRRRRSRHAFFEDVVNFVQQMGEAEGDKHAGDKFKQYWLPTIQATLMRSNAQAVLHRARRDRVAAGKRVADGLGCTFDEDAGPL